MLEKIVTIALEVQSSLKTIFTPGLECAQHYWNKKTNRVLGTGTSQSCEEGNSQRRLLCRLCGDNQFLV